MESWLSQCFSFPCGDGECLREKVGKDKKFSFEVSWWGGETETETEIVFFSFFFANSFSFNLSKKTIVTGPMCQSYVSPNHVDTIIHFKENKNNGEFHFQYFYDPNIFSLFQDRPSVLPILRSQMWKELNWSEWIMKVDLILMIT